MKRAGKSTADAVHEAQDLLNFSMHGDWQIVQWAITTVPFLNARLQGLYRLGRAGFSGDPDTKVRVPLLGWNTPWSEVGRVKIPGTRRTLTINKNVWLRGLMLAAISAAYWAMNQDDERYRDLQDWNKDLYYHFWFGEGEGAIHLRLPKPFEVGALFSTMVERSLDYMWQSEDDPTKGDALAKSFGRMILDTFAFNPMNVQIFKPLIEQYNNHLMFFDRPIETEREQNLSPELRFNERTSETARVIAEVMPDVLGDWANSPKRVEALLRGYFGSLGGYALSLTDIVSRELVEEGDEPDRRGYRDHAVVRRFLPPGPEVTRWTQEFYELRAEVNTMWADIKAQEARHEIEDVLRRNIEHAPYLQHRKQLNRIAKRLSKLRQEARMIASDPKMDGAEKRQRLDALTRQQNEITKVVLDIKRQIRDALRQREQ